MTADPIQAARTVSSLRCDDPEDRWWEDDDEQCFLCGGSGVLEGECECGDDTCCCLVPTPPICPECGGNG